MRNCMRLYNKVLSSPQVDGQVGRRARRGRDGRGGGQGRPVIAPPHVDVERVRERFQKHPVL